MGADVHIYPEFWTFDVRELGGPYWQDFATNMNPGRDYELFGILAGVRGQENPLVPLRGMPLKPAMMTQWANQLYVTESTTEIEGHCSRSSAESWIRTGCSTWVDADHKAVTNPDHHSHTWLTVAEFKACIELVGRDVAVSYYALLAALEELEKRGAKARVVMWFDN